MGKDLRRYASQTNRRLLLGFVLILILVGDGLILLIYGPSAALLGLVCILAGLFPLALIWFVLTGMEWLTKKVRQDE